VPKDKKEEQKERCTVTENWFGMSSSVRKFGRGVGAKLKIRKSGLFEKFLLIQPIPFKRPILFDSAHVPCYTFSGWW
jgi:hypothetical protein